MGKQIKSALVLFAALFLMIGLTAQTMAYVPDYLASSAQPATLDADGESTTDITVQLMAELDGFQDVVKMCGIEVTCESQDPDVLHNGDGGALLTGWTDEFGKVTFTYQSTGSEGYNEGDVEVICRSIQLEEISVSVHVETGVADRFHVTMCPKSGYDELSPATKQALDLDPHQVEVAQADIIADGSSHVYITAQLKNKYINPVHKNGTVRFKSMNTVIVKTCGTAGQTGTNAFGYNYEIIDTGVVLVEADEFGVATAEFCSAGTGSENVGTANIHIESVTYPNVEMNETFVKTTNQFGTTYKEGFLAMSSMADQIMADEVSCVHICAQTRDQDYRIIKKSGWQVLFESDETTLLIADPSLTYPDPNDVGLAYASTNAEGIALYKYCSASDYDPFTSCCAENLGVANVIGSAPTIVETATTAVALRTEQIWPVAVEVIATMPLVDCDGVSTVTLTAQLLDRCGLATKYEGRRVTFQAEDISGLKDPSDGDSVIQAYTNAYGVAHATFITTDCKFGGEDIETSVEVNTQSPHAEAHPEVLIVKPKGFVPSAISIYSDHTVSGRDEDLPAHAKPYLISADGEEKTYVTIQLCEMEYPQEREPYCNPVKRCGVEVEFWVRDNMVVQYKGDNPHALVEDVDHVVLETDCEGKATAIFRSTGNSPDNKEKCTIIEAHAINSEDLGYAYAEVCTSGQEGTYPNAIWVWADTAYLTADGTSHTVVRAALYDCYQNFEEWPNYLPEKGQLTQQPCDPYPNCYGRYYLENCKPVHMPGVTVKFETMNTDALDDGMGGYKIYDLTDEFGQAHATFQSKGFDKQHMGIAPIEVWTVGSGEDVVQLNELNILLEEKTWPWCPEYSLWFAAGSPEATADQDHDQYITDNELIEYIMNVWMNSYHPVDNPYGQDDTALIQVIVAWLTQL